MTNDEVGNMYVWLIENGIASEETVDVVTDINGYNMEALNDILYCKTGYRDREQYEEGEGL